MARGKPVLSARLRAEDASIAALRGKRVAAFAGIADPARFFRTLRAYGVEVVLERAFPDHHRFSQSEIESLIAQARREAARLVTTEKDLARLRDRQGLPDWAREIVPFVVALEIDNAADLRKLLSGWLFEARQKTLHARS